MSLPRSSTPPREIFTIARREDGWAVEHRGEYSHASACRDDVVAAAHRLARACHDSGKPAQVTVGDEPGFFPGFSTVR
jgi:hypothetical protein